jgi:hypothetical protein
MAMTGTAALDRSQASAEAETGSVERPVTECVAWVGVKAVYDDPWETPITDCQVRIKVDGSIVADGPRTKGLSTYGKEDGQPHADVRAKLGGYRHGGVKPGTVSIALVPKGDSGNADELKNQIYGKLSAFETSMRSVLQPWITEWAADGWGSVLEARRRGTLHGLATWWVGELDFWASVGNVAAETWAGMKNGMRMAAEWHDQLPWYAKSGLGLLGAIAYEAGKLAVDQVQELWTGAVELWERREEVMSLLKAFSQGTAKAIEKALAVLIDLPGDLGVVLKKLVHDSADWVQNMIEVARETDVFKRATNTIMTIVMMMTPNFWAEGLGMVEGYLLPEVLITIILIIISALCAAAGASALAARVTGVMSKLRVVIEGAGKTGRVLTTLFSKLDELADLIGNLSKTLRRKVDDAVDGVTDKFNRIVRRSENPRAALPEDLRAPKPNSVYEANGYVYKTDAQGRVKETSGTLRLEKADRNLKAQNEVGKLVNPTGDDGGHLIGSRFGGSGEKLNMVPQDSRLNRYGEWRKMEDGWAAALKEGKEVKIKINPIYGDSPRPEFLEVKYWVGGKVHTRVFEN